MILVDTSVWVDHLRAGDPALRSLLERGLVLAHPFVIGEIALGVLRQRDVILEALQLIGQAGLAGRGIGYLHAHLLASARLAGARLWTRAGGCTRLPPTSVSPQRDPTGAPPQTPRRGRSPPSRPPLRFAPPERKP